MISIGNLNQTFVVIVSKALTGLYHLRKGVRASRPLNRGRHLHVSIRIISRKPILSYDYFVFSDPCVRYHTTTHYRNYKKHLSLSTTPSVLF